MGFRAIVAKKRVSSPTSVYSKNCISGSQQRRTLGFCMEAIQSLKSLYQHWFVSEAQENHFSQFGPWSTQKVGNVAKMPILGHIYRSDTKAYTQIKRTHSKCSQTYLLWVKSSLAFGVNHACRQAELAGVLTRQYHIK